MSSTWRGYWRKSATNNLTFHDSPTAGPWRYRLASFSKLISNLQGEDMVVSNGLSDSSVKNCQVFERPLYTPAEYEGRISGMNPVRSRGSSNMLHYMHVIQWSSSYNI